MKAKVPCRPEDELRNPFRKIKVQTTNMDTLGEDDT